MATLTSRSPIQRPWHLEIRQKLSDTKKVKETTRSEWIPAEDASLSFHYSSEMIGSINEALSTLFDSRKTSPEVATTNLNIGLVCAVYCEGKWFRAEIVEMQKYPDIIVCLRDVGCYRNVNISDIRRLPEEFANLPRTVLRCSLDGINPLCGTTWDGKTTQ